MIPTPKFSLKQTPLWASCMIFTILSSSGQGYARDLNSAAEALQLRFERLFKEPGYNIYTKQQKSKLPTKSLDGAYSKLETDTSIYWVESYSDYNILKYKNIFYAIHRSEGLITPEDLRNFSKKQWVTELTISAVKSKLRFLLTVSDPQSPQHQRPSIEESSGVFELPILVHEGYKGFNIVKYDNNYYAVNQIEGPIDLFEIKEKAKFPWISGKTLDEILKKIDQLFRKMPLKTQIKYWIKSILNF